jgi:hypothetical protein
MTGYRSQIGILVATTETFEVYLFAFLCGSLGLYLSPLLNEHLYFVHGYDTRSRARITISLSSRGPNNSVHRVDERLVVLHC